MNFNILKRIDITLFIAVCFLIAIGLIVIFSTSYSSSGVDFLNFKKQAIFAFAGIIIMMALSFSDYRSLKDYTGVFYVFSCFILAAVLFSNVIKGASSWFDFGFLNFQPSELVKVIMVIIIAKYLSKTINCGAFKRIVISGIYILLPVFLIFLQPDLGSSLVIIFTWFAMLIILGIEKKYIIFFVIIGLLSFSGSWSFILKDYQKDRIITFLNPQFDPQGAGYNIIQSTVAVGSGSVWGKGIGYGSQSQLNFLPEKHTDFIFAVIAEEMGFIGVLLVLGLFGVVFHRFSKIAIEAQDNFGKFLVLGSSFVLAFHIIVNVGMNMGIMPITGIPLPFLSYGGSSLLSFLIIIGLVQSVYVKRRKYKIEKEESHIL